MPRIAKPLTDLAIKRAKSVATPRRLFDGYGLYIEILPSGGKFWRFRYRSGGKENPRSAWRR